MFDALQLEPAALTRSVRHYSKGMTQKLGLAACLLARKPLYILDEPMSGLDPKARALLTTRPESTPGGPAAASVEFRHRHRLWPGTTGAALDGVLDDQGRRARAGRPSGPGGGRGERDIHAARGSIDSTYLAYCLVCHRFDCMSVHDAPVEAEN